MLARMRLLMRASHPPPEPEPPSARAAPSPSPDPELARLEAEARYHRDRLALYRARVYASKPTSNARLRELERASAFADARLHSARRP